MNNFQELHSKKHLKIKDLLDHPAAELFEKIKLEINSTSARQILWHAEQSHSVIPTCVCGKNLAWHPDRRCYRDYCSVKCSTNNTKEKIKQTNLEKYGVEHYSQTADYAVRVKATNLQRYGFESYRQTQEGKARTKATNNIKYGGNSPMSSQHVKDKFTATMIHRHGAKTPLQSPKIRAKITATNLEKYGSEWAFSNQIVKEKINATNLEKYGFTRATSSPAMQEHIIAVRRLDKYGETNLALLDDAAWIEKEYKSGRSVPDIAEQIGLEPNQLYKYFKKYKIKLEKRNISHIESKLAKHYASLGFDLLIRDTEIIKPKELDIVFEKQKLAIEVNGSYYHSEQFNKNHFYHINKTSLATAAGYALLQFWDWEIQEKWPQVIGYINTKLGINQKIGARTLTIKLISSQEKKQFLNSYHLQGDHQSSLAIGLVDKHNDIKMLMTFGKSRFNKAHKWELIRLCSKEGITVQGGSSKIFKYFIDNYLGQDSLISYSDLRISQGQIYENLGFEFKMINDPGYCYVKSGNYAGSRNAWQKHKLKDKLEIFDENLSEHANMSNNGYYRLWDCGQSVWTYQGKI